MNAKLKSPGVVAAAATVLLMISIFAALNYYRINVGLTSELLNEKLHSEKLLSETLALQKDLEKRAGELESLRGTNTQLDGALQRATAELAAQQAQYARVVQEAKSQRNYRKQYEELASIRTKLEKTVADLNMELIKAQLENHELETSLASLQERNRQLENELRLSYLASIDQPRIETMKGRKDKLTVAARKTRKMTVNVEVPAALRDISFVIKDPSGKALSDKSGTIASKVVSEDVDLVASASDNVYPVKGNKKIQMDYRTTKPMSPGIYTVEILSEGLYVGSVQVKLK